MLSNSNQIIKFSLTEPVATTPIGVIFAVEVTVRLPTDPIEDCPVIWTVIPRAIDIVPNVLVPASPDVLTFAFATKVTDPTDPVIDTPDMLIFAFAPLPP